MELMVETLRIEAEQGHAEAQYRLGRLYAKGQDVPQSCTEAARWYQMAAEQGQVSAQLRLGVMYDEGRGVLQIHSEAAYWLRLAAEQGDANAQFLLSVMYYKGQGVPQDFVRAHMWVDLAASRSQADARDGPTSARGLFTEQMPPDQLAEAQRLAGEWRPKTWAELKGVVRTLPRSQNGC
jgi:hypothetical protein